MISDREAFRDRMIEANRAIIALEKIEPTGDSKGVAHAVSAGLRIYQQLVELPAAARLTPEGLQLLEITQELLLTKLRNFGYAA